MPQLHLYVPEEMAATVKQQAEARGMSVSKYLAELVQRDLGRGWPPGYFEQVVGGWSGQPLIRPAQGRFERRGKL